MEHLKKFNSVSEFENGYETSFPFAYTIEGSKKVLVGRKISNDTVKIIPNETNDFIEMNRSIIRYSSLGDFNMISNLTLSEAFF